MTVAYRVFVPLPMVKPGPMMPLLSPALEETDVLAGSWKFSRPPLALVTVALAIARLLAFPLLGVSEIVLARD